MTPAITRAYQTAEKHAKTLGDVQRFDVAHLGKKWFDYRVTFTDGKTKMIYVEIMPSGKTKIWKPTTKKQ